MSTTIKLSGIAWKWGELVDASAAMYAHESMAQYAVTYALNNITYDNREFRVWTPMYRQAATKPSEWLITRLEDSQVVGYICLLVED